MCTGIAREDLAAGLRGTYCRSVVTDPTAPATKADIALLMQEMGKLYDANYRWKEELKEYVTRWKIEMMEKMDKWKDDLHRHFDVVAEDMRHDVFGINNDRFEVHEDRIRRLERKAGIR